MNKFDSYHINMARTMLMDAGLKIEKAQEYAIKAGLEQGTTIPRLLAKLLSTNQRAVRFLLDYLEVALEDEAALEGKK